MSEAKKPVRMKSPTGEVDIVDVSQLPHTHTPKGSKAAAKAAQPAGDAPETPDPSAPADPNTAPEA